MSENMALGIEIGLVAIAAIGAMVAGVVYALTDGKHGGVTCVILALITLSDATSLWSQAHQVINK